MTGRCDPMCQFLGCASCEYASGENPPAATESDARTGVAYCKIGAKQDGSQPRCVNTSTGSLTADSTPAIPGGISG